MCLGPEILAGIGGLSGLASTALPLVGSLATSLIGGQLQASSQREQQNEQLNQNLAAESARNATLQRFLAQQEEYQSTNQKTLDSTIADASQPKVAGVQAADATQRMQNADSAVKGVITPNIAPPSATGSNLVQNDLNARVAAGQGRATAQTNAAATLGAYGDVNAYLHNSALNAERQIGTTNDFARGDAALLPSEQQFAEFEARAGAPINPVSTFGSGVQGLGNVFAALAGSRRNATTSLFS